MKKEKNSGIYIIKNLINNKIYVGSSFNIEKRFKEHKRQLKKNEHKNSHLQSSYNKYGESSFIFQMLVTEKEDVNLTEEKYLRKMEEYYIILFRAYNNKYGYNIGVPGKGPDVSFSKKNFENGDAKITWDTLLEILELLQHSTIPCAEIDKKYNLTPGYTALIYSKFKFKKITQNLVFKERKSLGRLLWEENKDKILEDFYSGLSIKKISKKYNINESSLLTFFHESNIDCKNNIYKKIYLFDFNGKMVKSFDSVNECGDFLGIKNKSCLSVAVRRHDTIKGYIISFSEKLNYEIPKIDQLIETHSSRNKAVVQYDKNGNPEVVYKSSRIIHKSKYRRIAELCKNKDFRLFSEHRWKYVEDLTKSEINDLLKLKEEGKIKIVNNANNSVNI